MSIDTYYRTSSLTLTDHFARGLAFFSFALGAAELLFPGAVARATGLDESRRGLVRAYGLREIASGLGAIQPNPAPALWSRVAGDLVDLATVAPAMRNGQERRRKAAYAAGAVVAITVLDVVVAMAATRAQARPSAVRDFSDRSGFPGGVESARGAVAGYVPQNSTARLPPERSTSDTARLS